MKTIPLTHGLEAIVDDEDYEELSKFKWYAVGHTGQEYAARYGGHDSPQHIRMHRVLIRAPDGMQVDHINGNRLDNRKENLRLASQAQNSRNRGKFAIPTYSRYKGVSYHKRDHVWQAEIKVDGKAIYLGSFTTEREAALAYNIAARQYHGNYAKLNEIMEEKDYE